MIIIKKWLGLLLVAFMVTIVPECSFAQSAADYYKRGLAQMKKRQYNDAIESFTASMAINKGATNVKQCKKQIKICYVRIKPNDDLRPKPVLKKLSLSTDTVYVRANPEPEYSVKVETTPKSAEWRATVESEVTWVNLMKSMDSQELLIQVQTTDKTIDRDATITVFYGDLNKKIHVVQSGKAVELAPSVTFAKFKKKGGQTLIDITCNSDTTYYNNFNWYIEKAPDWCKAEGTSSNLVLNVEPIQKSDPLYKAGRSGDIIIRSQEKECVIRIDQK